MKRRQLLMFAFAVFLFAVLPYGLIRAERAISAPTVAVSQDTWPVWPVPDTKINGMEVLEPATFLSIGRDVISWVYFGNRPDDDGFVSADVYYLVKKSEMDGSIYPFAPSISNSDPFFLVPTNSALGNPTDTVILGGLRDYAVFPVYKQNWLRDPLVSPDTYYPNEDFLNETHWLQMDRWVQFLRGNHPTVYKYADTGHAPPQIVWDVDPWLEAFVSGYAPPSAWNNRIVGMISTNQGTLQGFEINAQMKTNVTPNANRKWLTVPNPAFRQSIYHTLRNMYSGVFKRLTLLDGPFTVRDVEIDGTWKRIVVGTTGIGTKQAVKPLTAWEALGQPPDPSVWPTPIPVMKNAGRIFGAYAYDITSLTDTPTVDTLKPLWSVTNANFIYSDDVLTFSGFYPVNNTGATEYNGYSDLKYSTSKPLIGYTKNETSGVRTWHSILLGIDVNGKYRWIDANPKDGKNLQNSVGENFFKSPVTILGGTVTVASSDETQVPLDDNGIYFNEEQVETLYPSRILAAFPDPNYDPQEPLLGAIYVYLSNGSLYRWDLNKGQTPQWIATFQNQDGDPMAPLTDFDISYVSGDTYLAANVTFTYNGASEHQTPGLLVVNLDKIEDAASKDVTKAVIKKAPPGQGGARYSSDGSILMVQLQGTQGAYSPYSKEVLASPVFIKEKLYLAFYEISKKTDLSRLYTFDFARLISTGKNNEKLIAYNGSNAANSEFYDLKGQQVVNMFVDSKGNLVLIGEDGKAALTLPTGLVYEGTGGGGGSSLFNKMKVIYWRRI